MLIGLKQWIVPGIFAATIVFLSTGPVAGADQAAPPCWVDAAVPGAQVLKLECVRRSPRIRTDRLPTPDSTDTAFILSGAKSGSADFPLGVSLPAGTASVGVWFQGSAGDQLVFHLNVGDSRQSLAEQSVEGLPPEPRHGSDDGFESRWRNWTFRQVYLQAHEQPVMLESIEVRGPGTEKMFCSPMIRSQATPRHLAKRVWKLKDMVLPKPSSIGWTAINYYEYGYDRDCFMSPSVAETLLANESIRSLGIDITRADGTPVDRLDVAPDQMKCPIPLPGLAEGTYLLRLHGYDEGGLLVKSAAMVYQILRDDVPVGAQGSPRPAPIQVDGIRYDGPSALAGEPLNIQVRLNNRKSLALIPKNILFTATDTEGHTVSGGKLDLAAAESRATLSLPTNDAGGFILKIDLMDTDGRRLEQWEGMYGVAEREIRSQSSSSATMPAPRYDSVVSLNMFGVHFDGGQMKRLPTHSLPSLLDLAAQAKTPPQFTIAWNELEPVQGCYQWRLLDRLLDMATARGMPAWISISFTGDNLPQWLWFEELMDQNQETIHASYHYVSPFGPRLQRAQDLMNAHVARHYAQDPRVAGLLIQAGPSEGFLTDTPPQISDYSPAARRAFTRYLQEKYGDNLDALNQAWGMRFNAWQQAVAPVPSWNQPWENSRSWYDFHQFKAVFVTQRLSAIVEAVRKVAPTMPLMMYAKEGFGSTCKIAPIFARHRARYTNGGGETTASYIQSCIMRNSGVAANPEGHFVMPNTGSVAMVIANSLWAAPYQGQNIQWGMVWTKTPHEGVSEYQAVAQLSAAMARHQDEMRQTVPLLRTAGYFNGLQSMLQGRSFRTELYPGVSDLMTLTGDQLFSLCDWVDDETDLDVLRRFPLIVDAGSQIVAPERFDQLLEYIRQGGTLLATTDTGRFVPGQNDPANLLCRNLGAAGISLGASRVVRDAEDSLTLKRVDRIDWRQSSPDVIAKSIDGMPLAYRATLGKGTVYLLAGEIQFRKSARFVQMVIDAAGERNPYQCAGENMTVRPLRGPLADYLVVVPAVPGTGLQRLNEPMARLAALPRRDLTVRGIASSQPRVTELLSRRQWPIENGAIRCDLAPGMVHILKIAR